MTTKVLVVGIGNELRQDDAVGIIITKRIEALKLPYITVRYVKDDLTKLYTLWEGYSIVVLVDAMECGKEPGACTILPLTSETLQQLKYKSIGTTHSLPLLAVIGISKVLGNAPSQVYLVGVQIRSVMVGEQLSKETEQYISEVIQKILRVISQLVNGYQSFSNASYFC
ncbi:MAG: hydrogenase maturation protease [Bacteroidetes bacterium]|nr:hydrogenase maturation protease [Bacteroidota bacterium]